MRVPLSWLAEYAELPEGAGAAEVAADLVRVGLEEERLDTGDVSGPLVVGRVLALVDEAQRNGRTIRWCSVDVGDGAADGPAGRGRGIVCGAHNFAVGDLVVVALPGSVLAGGLGISARKTYGHVSDGMICSARELGLGDDHEGIIVLGELLGPEAAGLAPGADVIPPLGLAEEVVEVNVTPDRGYCLSVRGIAREYVHGRRADVHAAYRDPAALPLPAAEGPGHPVVLADQAPIGGWAGCDRFVARVVRGVNPDAPSPWWLRRRLQLAGMRPISLAVDVTNYVMLALGQPLHAYDLGRLAGAITVRRARRGERLTTLDGVDRALDAEDLLITDGPDGQRVIGLAGVMGGASTEVSGATTDVLVEAAHFDPVSVSRTARRHRLGSEASRRFERGVDDDLQAAAAELAVRLLVEHGGGTPDPGVTDVDERPPRSAVLLPAEEPARLVGRDFTVVRVTELLEQVGCTVAAADRVLEVTPPSWRPDLVQAADLVEEIARLDGYSEIPSVLPVAPPGRGLTPAQRVRRSVSRTLAEAGLVEVLSSPFLAGDRHDELGLSQGDPRRNALRLSNPLSDEQPFLRTSVLSTLVDVLRRNVGRTGPDVALFEVGQVARPDGSERVPPRLAPGVHPEDDQLADLHAAVPYQPTRVAGLVSGRWEQPGWWGPGRPVCTADAVELVCLVAGTVGVDVEIAADRDHPPWHPGRCAVLRLADGTLLGHAGELHPGVLSRLALPPRTVAFEIDVDALVAALDGPVRARPVSTYPAAREDVALVVADEVPAESVRRALADGVGDLLEEVRLFDVYTGDPVAEGHKSLAFSLRLRAPDRTLTAEEANAARDAAVTVAAQRTGAVLRSA
ncbi:MAG TPA: phenylalanine--tRNA ligase subunit beta [Jiangellales bacterium]|nr:phenylalanine--tRNA ligase subunit beta [Jiangellales bacterium]